ncbi:MAG TPA: histidinol-phosphate transaminase [Dissulfurispiraceae bacterium]|nr:histidinol-phosphate transaminase [Dissulfurispiraceae bacterium]
MKKIDLSRLVRPDVKALRAYEAKEVKCKVKLDANESPYSPLPSDKIFCNSNVLQKLNRYPDPEARALKKAIAKSLNVDDSNLLLGNGSDELIYYLVTTFGGPVLFPVPTFVMYGIIAQALGQNPVAIPLDGAFDLDIKKMLETIGRQKPKLIFLSSPNNPSGNCYSTDRILKIIEASKGIVVVDEAYQPFSSGSGFLPFLKDYRNLIILRTMSKIGFASLRVGYMIAESALIKEINKVRLPYNLNSLSQVAALEAVKNKRAINARVRVIASERNWLFNALSRLKGISPYPSEANFILFRVAGSDKIYRGLLKQGVLIKNMNKIISDSMRVTVGTREENQAFIDALNKVLIK